MFSMKLRPYNAMMNIFVTSYVLYFSRTFCISFGCFSLQVTNFKEISMKYGFPEETCSSLLEGLSCKLTSENYKSKYHKLVYLEEMAHSRKMIQE